MKLTPETVYVRSFNKNAEYEIWISNSREHELEYPADAKLNHYCLSKEELGQVITDAIHWGVGTYQEQLAGGSPTNTQIQYYLSEKLS